jgi:hypothetical protein
VSGTWLIAMPPVVSLLFLRPTPMEVGGHGDQAMAAVDRDEEREDTMAQDYEPCLFLPFDGTEAGRLPCTARLAWVRVEGIGLRFQDKRNS